MDMDAEIKMTLKALEKNKFDARLAENSEIARDMVLEMVPAEAVVGIGDSVTVRGLGIFEEFTKRGIRYINPFVKEILTPGEVSKDNMELLQKNLRRSLGNDIYISGTNAVTMDGKLVNIDHAGNRVAAMIFGAPKVILVIGRNKIVKDVDAAIYRIKNVIVPALAKRRERKLPCAATGECRDCNSPGRMCAVTTIIEKEPHFTRTTIVLVNEDLGLGWDPAWPQARINKIIARHYELSWSHHPAQNQ